MAIDFKHWRHQLGQIELSHNLARAQVKRSKQSIAVINEHLEHLSEAQQVLQQVAAGIQQKAHEQIASVVTRCLQAIFDEPYEFRIHFERKRGRTEARLAFYRGGHEIDPMTASGGGVVDVAAFASRLACLMLARPKVRRLLVLDEPFKFLSVEYRPRLRELLLSLAKEMGVQIVLVTHMPELEIGRVVDLDLF